MHPSQAGASLSSPRHLALLAQVFSRKRIASDASDGLYRYDTAWGIGGACFSAVLAGEYRRVWSRQQPLALLFDVATALQGRGLMVLCQSV